MTDGKDNCEFRFKLAGNGCYLYQKCETCPLPDCQWQPGANKQKQQNLIKLWQTYLPKMELQND